MTRARLNLPPAVGMSCSDDGRMLACIGSKVVVVDLVNRRRLPSSLPFSHPIHTAFSPNGSRLAVKSTSGRIAIIDPLSGAVMRNFGNHSEGEGCAVRFSPDGRELVDGSWAGDLTVRSLTGQLVRRLSFPDARIKDIIHDLTRNLWLVLHQPRVRSDYDELPPGYVSIWQWPFSETPLRTVNFDMVIDAICSSPDGRLMVFVEGYEERRAHIAHVSDGQIVASSGPIGERHLGVKLAWSRDSRFIATTVKGGGLLERYLVLLDAGDLSVLAKLPCSMFSDDLLFLPDGTSFAFGGVDNRCKVMPLVEVFLRGRLGGLN